MQPRAFAIKGKTFYRTVNSEWLDTILESGPSFVGGGRFNVPELFGAIYFSEDKEVAYQEWLREREPDETGAHTTVAFEVFLSRIVEADSGAVYQPVEWRSGGDRESQRVGRRYFLENIEGIVYKSSKSEKVKNLAVFPANILRSNAIRYVKKVA